MRELRASQAAPTEEQLFSSISPHPSPAETERQTPDDSDGRHAEEVSSQSTDSGPYQLPRHYFDSISQGQENDSIDMPPGFSIDQLIFATPDVLPFDFEPAPSSAANRTADRDRGLDLFQNENAIDVSKEAIIAEVSRCFSAVYQRYPLWHLDTLLSKIEQGEYATCNEFRSICLSIYLLNESVLFRKNPRHGSSRIMQIMEEIESTRAYSNKDHFAECPSTNSAIVSLTMFIAYSVCDRYNLAFYHLNEAAGLLRLIDIDTLDSHEKALYRRLEAVLFITESASMLVYGKARKNRMICCPDNLSNLESSMRWYSEDHRPNLTLPSALADIRLGSLDNKAVNLLHALVCLYNATTAEEISKVSIPSPAISDIIEQGAMGDTSLQAADVDITRQWQLCLRWQQVLSSRKSKAPSRCNPGAGYTLQIMGLTVLQYSRAIRPEECRIVGHGKLAGLAMAIYDIASNLGVPDGCAGIIGDLIRTVYDMDYERHFAPELSLVQLCIERVPRQITWEQNASLMGEQGAAS